MDELTNSLKLLSISAAAKELNIGASKLQSLIENGEIGVISLPNGRLKVPFNELVRWLREKTRFAIKENYGKHLSIVEPFNPHKILFNTRSMKV